MSDNDMIRRGDVLAIVKPDGARDCDCTRCTCGDEIEVSLWDQSKRHSDAIAALPAARIIAALDPEALAKIRADALREAAELVDDFRRAPATAGLGCDPMIEAILALIDKEDQA